MIPPYFAASSIIRGDSVLKLSSCVYKRGDTSLRLHHLKTQQQASGYLRKMFAVLVCILTLHQVHSACVLQDICPDNTAVQNEIVDLHNNFRKNVDPPASNMLMMNYSTAAAANAQAWVEQCTLGHGTVSSRMLNGYEMGENLFISSHAETWTSVITAWHSEVSVYKYPDSADKTTGHYTQVVWATSYEVGCGVAYCSDRNVYFYSCHYFRAGNYLGVPPYSTGNTCGDCSDNCSEQLCKNPCPHIDYYTNCPYAAGLCGYNSVKTACPATCNCVNGEIIPIY